MEENPLVKKLRIKTGQNFLTINPPAGFVKTMQPIPSGVNVSEKLSGTYDHVLLFPFNATLSPYGGVHYMGITKELRKKCGLQAGDTVKVVLERDVDARKLEMPADLAQVLDKDLKAKLFFEKSSYTNRKEYIGWIETAKKQETRESRIQKAVDRLSRGLKFS